MRNVNDTKRYLIHFPCLLRAGHVARMGEKRNVYRLLVRKLEGRRPLGRPRRRWLDNIRMDLVEVGWGDVDWICLAQDRDRWRALVNSVLNFRVQYIAGKLSSVQRTMDLSSSAQLYGVSYVFRSSHSPRFNYLVSIDQNYTL
jgi:hypothetical protein